MTHWIWIISIFLIGIGLMILWQNVDGAEREDGSMIEYIGTSDWLNEVDKCVDLYQETEQNETLYYGCMNKIERDNVHYQ